MSSISNGVRATFEHAHKLLQLCINSLQAFNGYNHRLQFPGDYTRGAVPWECQSPETLWHLWQQMRRDIDSLEIDYFHAPGTSVDIIRALKASPVPIAPILATEATTHIEALCEIASQISGRFSIVSESLPKLFDEASDDDVVPAQNE